MFHDLLTAHWADALQAQGITTPTPIQSQALPVLLENKDLYLSAPTGTGKTLTYLLPILEKLDAESKDLQALILVPTHELAVQVAEVFRGLAQRANQPLKTALLIGGAATKKQIEALKKKPQMAIATPGRALELIKARKLKMHTIQTLVVDEADRMLSGTVVEEVDRCIKATLKERQLIFCSATHDPESLDKAKNWAPELTLCANEDNAVSSTLEHFFLVCEDRDRPDVTRKLLHALDLPQAIVFCHKKFHAERLSEIFNFHHLPAADLHNAKNKMERQKAMRHFRQGKINVLIASDVGARGLDVKDLAVVVNCDAPSQPADYLHRAGRCGRAGQDGQVFTILNEQELHLIKRYEKELDLTISEVQLRNGKLKILDAKK